MSKPARVLQIVTTMNRGGLETMLMNYYRSIDKTKIQFDFLIHRSDKSDYEDEILSLGGKIYHISNLNPFSFKYRKVIKKFFMEHKEYTVVHCHLDCMSSIPLYYAKKAGIPTRIAHSHNSNQDRNLKYLLKIIYRNKISSVATELFACGSEAGKWMFNGKEFKIINNAINTQIFLYNTEKSIEIKRKLNLDNKFVIGHVGRFNEPKNHKFIIDIFFELTKLNDNVHLLLVGDGSLKKEIEKKVNELGINDNVIFYGKNNSVNEIMQAFDVFLFPSLYEGVPLTIVEAQASGLKCFISDKVPRECILTENVEILNLSDSAVKWAHDINKYKDGYIRRNTIEEIRDSGYDIKNNAKKLEEFYFNEINK